MIMRRFNEGGRTMANLEKFINPQGAEALRQFAAAMPFAIMNITQATEKMNRIYGAIMDGLGVRSENFKEILECVESAQKKAAEALEYLPPELEKTAAKIDDYIAKNYGISSGN